MKKLGFRILICYCLCLLVSSFSGIDAQPERLQFKHLTPDEGLSSSIVLSIIQDHTGLMWIGTSDGLNRYDGYNFVVFRNDPSDSTSLANNVVRTLYEDRNHVLFIGTENGLCSYDSKRNSFVNYSLKTSSPLKGISCIVLKIIEDSLGNFWLATSVGLIYFDRNENKIKQFTHDESRKESLSNDNVESVLIDRSGTFWVSTRQGLNIFLPEKGTFKHVTKSDDNQEDLSNIVFMSLVEDPDGNIWVGGSDGLFCIQKTKNSEISKIIHYQNDKKDKSSLSINQVESIFVDNKNNLWIGTENGGLELFDKGTQKFWHYRKDDYDPQSLNNESIEAIYQDKTGILWIGTYTGGLNVVMNNRNAIIKYQNLPGAQLSLSNNTVMSFLEDSKGRIWIGTDGGGLNLFNRETDRFIRFNLDNSTLSSNSVISIYEDSKNQIWLGTWAGGLVKFNPESRSFESQTTENSGIQDNNIYAIAEGNNNDLWLGTFEHGLLHYQIKEKKFTAYSTDNSRLSNNMVVKVVKFSKGRLLIGTTSGFQIFSQDNAQFTPFRYDPGDNNSISYPRVTDILVENDSSVWIATPKGLNRFNPNNGSFKRYFDKDGLPNNYIKGIILDKSGALWMTTNGGVCRFDYNQGSVKTFTKADGFQGNEFSERSILKTKDEALLMGGTKGFNMVYPEKIAENKNIPDILITDLKIFNKTVNPGTLNSPLSQNITETKSFTLPYYLSVLTFSFAVMDYSAPEKNQYAYMMENFDRDWIFPGNKNEVTYTNLSPGNYVFHVKGSNNDGVWNEAGTSIKITILPPWWSTWWFRLIMVFTIISILSSIYFSRVSRFKKQKVLLEKLVAMKTAELKDLNASKDKFFSIIAHDLKNPFSNIIGLSGILKEELKSGDPKMNEECVEMINVSAVQSLKLLENLLEWAKSQTGNLLFKPVSIKLNELYFEEFDLLNEMAIAKNIQLLSSIPDNLVIKADSNMIRTVLRNLISNALKFTHKGGKIEVNTLVDDNQVEISVSDNGIGMTKSTIDKLFRIDANLSTNGTEDEKGTGLGLFLCKEFIEKHGGKIWVESESGKGSIFKFILPF